MTDMQAEQKAAAGAKIWLASYPETMPAEIPPLPHRSIGALFDHAVATFGPRKAYSSMGKSLTFSDLDRLSAQVGAWLQSTGLARGERVAVMMPNILQNPVVTFAILRAGFAVVNVNPLYTPRELEYQLKDSGAKALFVLENFAHTVAQVVARTEVRHLVVTTMGDLLGLKGHIVNLVVRRVKKLVPAWSLPGHVPFRAVLKQAQGVTLTKPDVAPSDIAFLQYTGGTTGVSKGAVLTHANLLSNMAQIALWVNTAFTTRPRPEVLTFVCALPLYHIFALTVNALIGLTLGGGMAVQRPVAERWRTMTGCPIAEGYGLSETSPVVSANLFDTQEFSGTIGLPLPSTEIEIRDDDGRTLPIGETGEICIRGPQVMAGYWQKPAETADAIMADGFFRSGDIGFMNPAGYVKIVDRKKDMILVSGFNVYPNEIEEVAAGHPGVLECAAIGVPDAHSGEAVKLFVVKREPTVTEAEIKAHCAANLTNYKRPKLIEFRDALPKTPVGKILRKDLRG